MFKNGLLTGRQHDERNKEAGSVECKLIASLQQLSIGVVMKWILYVKASFGVVLLKADYSHPQN